MNQVKIVKLHQSQLGQVLPLVVSAMASNPIHNAVYSGSETARQSKQYKVFRFALQDKSNVLYAAVINDEIVGIMNYTDSSHCQIAPLRLIVTLPVLLAHVGRDILRLVLWRKAWGKMDPRNRHLHLGPLAVKSECQGKGIGKQLVAFFCDILDQAGQNGYLETDKLENVRLYERFGFRVSARKKILGVTCWFMIRMALTDKPKVKN